VLILCGSYLGFMEREVLGRESPLFGRRTAQILLRPFGYREAALFHRSWSHYHRALAYFVCGGVPLYLRAFDESRSVEQSIEATLLDEHAPLFREPEFLLREELRDVESYYAVLSAIAAGSRTIRDIATAARLPERSLPYYLQQLVELGYVARRYPLTSRKPSNRDVRFVLEDALLRFWFRFVFPSSSFIQHVGARRAYHERIKPQLDAYYGYCFERLCREALPRLYEREGIDVAFQVGEYWDKTTQIDVVGLREDGFIDLGECKWGSVRSEKALAAELEPKLDRYPTPSTSTLCRRFFVRELSKRPRATPSARWHDLVDLYR
jgi:AAA+ ATPase superfamily predicted ATPase